MKKRILLYLLLSTVGFCYAQDELPTVVPDRPGYVWGTEVTPHRKIIWDNGFGFERTPDGARTLTLNTTMLRYGLFKNMEIRVGTDFMLLYDSDAARPTFGIAPLSFGTKICLYESKNLLPSVGFLAELRSPHIGSKELLPSHLAPSMYLLFEHSFGEHFWLCYNVGLEWDGETSAPKTYLALGLGYNFTESLGAFIETYNYLHSVERSQHMTELGFTWLVSRKVQLDIETDIDWRHLGKYYSVSCGVSWLIN